ncbi:solute carrier organic anion transporter family member 1B3-like [Spea bombifrons]|uniref:solute carrier organic anion transporter family member 1B3-like n=1 Tax=Spea bombifrons TaxID=233779 RepID=UPI00234AA31B|nr:solute carrier organic anion transporter family member 1B3-like [Spea bombifrons]
MERPPEAALNMTVEKESNELNNLNPTQPNPKNEEEKVPPKTAARCDPLKEIRVSSPINPRSLYKERFILRGGRNCEWGAANRIAVRNASAPRILIPALLQLFLAALCFTYFAKAFSGSYVKSSLTQIERRFDLPSSTVGMIDGSFEFGNLLMIAVVSYFGAKLHRPRIIAGGCLIMSVGSFLTATPHFFMGQYKYESLRTQPAAQSNLSAGVSPCLANRTLEDLQSDCGKETRSYLWVCMLIGNLLRGIGETPITPLGISYLDDFSRPENTPLYIAILHTVALFGPMTGFMLGSFCAKLYVDIGFVDLDSITISPQDSRWVGAWWLGFLIAGAINLLSGIPFCFLPKSLKSQSEEAEAVPEKMNTDEKERDRDKATVKGFFLSLKTLLCSPLYAVLLCVTLLQMNSFLGFITYKPKYMEQQYGQSASRANFITGVSTLPAAALGVFLGGLIMKRYKFGLLSASKMSFATSLVAFLLSLSVFVIGCENNDVAGLTVAYDGVKPSGPRDGLAFAPCNSDCECSPRQWDPVCGENRVTYMSACLAGCKSSTGSGRDRVYYNCSCIGATGFQATKLSATLGTCPRSENCSKMFLYYTISQAFVTFIFALGGSATYIIVMWSVSPELKALAIGVYMLLIRTLAGIPAPIYFGALIDKTCLKWGTNACGGKGACRMYDAASFRNTFLGLTAGIRAPIYIIYLGFIYMVKQQLRGAVGKAPQTAGSVEEAAGVTRYENEASKEEREALGAESGL